MRLNIFFVFLIFSSIKGEELLKIKLEDNTLKILLAKNIHIVKILKNYAFVVIKEGEQKKLEGLNFETLDRIDEGKYYLVTIKEKGTDLSRYCKVIFNEDDIFLIKIYDDKNLKEIIKQKIFLQYLTLKPISPNKGKFNVKFKYDQTIQNIVNSVNPDTILSFVMRLQDFKSRYSTYDSCFQAAIWIKDKFYEYGCDTVILQYHTYHHAPNVIGIKYGTLYSPDHYSIICGHFDSFCFEDSLNAPGADDNASGTASVLECARVLKDCSFEYTIRFIAFSGEEFGLYGSETYADFARIMNDTIVGVINADMIGYTNHSPDTISVFADDSLSPSDTLAELFIECAENYTSLLCLKIINSIPFSDHASFWDKGFNAIGLIEEIGSNANPYVHSSKDTIGLSYNNNLFATEVVKTIIATIASISCLSPLPEAPIPPLLIQPFDCSKFYSPYPEFSFSSTDPQRDSIQYLILIDETATFSSPESILTSIYPSDTIVKYQLTSPLEHGNVYFWKVKAKDPYGTNYWSLFSDVHSFTIDTTLPYNTCSFLQCNFNQFSKNNLINLKIVGDSVMLETYGYIYDTLLYEDFEDVFPQNWGINDGNNDGIYWTNGTSDYLGIYTPPNYHSKYAYYDDYPAGFTNNTAEEIISPPVYIPAGSTDIKIIYDYGIRCLESGEKMILKTRKFNSGSWSSWINRYTHYQSSFGTYSYQIPSNYFPLESLQVKWTYTDASTINHRGYGCAIDNVLFVKTITFENNYGEMLTKDIRFCELSGLFERDFWGDLIFEKSDEEDSIGITIQYYNGSCWENVPDNLLPGNSIGIFTAKKSDTISLNLLDTLTYNRIRVKVLFKRYTQFAKSGSEPSLLRLEVGNLSRYVGIDEIKEDIFDISGNIFYSDLEVRFLLKKDEHVSISLFDITGRNVKNIINGEKMTKGFHKIKISYERMNEIPRGVYFLYFEAGNIKRIKKLILIG